MVELENSNRSIAQIQTQLVDSFVRGAISRLFYANIHTPVFAILSGFTVHISVSGLETPALPRQHVHTSGFASRYGDTASDAGRHRLG